MFVGNDGGGGGATRLGLAGHTCKLLVVCCGGGVRVHQRRSTFLLEHDCPNPPGSSSFCLLALMCVYMLATPTHKQLDRPPRGRARG